MKPWEEEWHVIEQPAASEMLPTIWCGADEVATMAPDMRASAASENARARLAAAAPDLVRVLLAVEWGASGAWGALLCPACDLATEHKADCQLDAALRKAGVR